MFSTRRPDSPAVPTRSRVSPDPSVQPTLNAARSYRSVSVRNDGFWPADGAPTGGFCPCDADDCDCDARSEQVAAEDADLLLLEQLACRDPDEIAARVASLEEDPPEDLDSAWAAVPASLAAHLTAETPREDAPEPISAQSAAA